MHVRDDNPQLHLSKKKKFEIVVIPHEYTGFTGTAPIGGQVYFLLLVFREFRPIDTVRHTNFGMDHIPCNVTDS